jgi:hypothetical protein
MMYREVFLIGGFLILVFTSLNLYWCSLNLQFALMHPSTSLRVTVTKKSKLKIQNSKTTSKLCSAARAVRLSGSTRGLLPLRFLVVFYAF